MQRIAMVVPIKPGKTEDIRKYVDELTGSRADDDAALQREVGVRRQTVWLHPTEAGESLVIYQEVEDPERFRTKMEELAASGHPHLAWKRERYRELYDYDQDQGPPPPLELLADRAF